MLGFALTYASSSIPKKEQGKAALNDFILLHHYLPWPMRCRMVPWVSPLLSSLILICKSWWGAAAPLLEVVFHWLLDFSIRKFFLHSVIIDDEQVSKMTHCKGGAFFHRIFIERKSKIKIPKNTGWNFRFFGEQEIWTALEDVRSLIFYMVKS